MLSYEVPLHYGLIDKATILDQRYSNTMSDESFARESLSIWSGNSSEAWFDSAKILKRRTLLRCERENKIPKGSNAFYIVGVDIGRYSANTAIMVIKVLPEQNNFKKNVVYTEVLHDANYITEQAPRIKKIIEKYQPREVVIDGNGPGIGLLEAMALPSTDIKTGEQFVDKFSKLGFSREDLQSLYKDYGNLEGMKSEDGQTFSQMYSDYLKTLLRKNKLNGLDPAHIEKYSYEED